MGSPDVPATGDADSACPLRSERFRVLERLGGGAMGTVYRAFDEVGRREVALKILHPGDDPEEHVARFRREGRTGASLEHPGIVRTLDLGVERGIHYLVQELVRGPSLKRAIAAGPIEFRRAAAIVRDLAWALEYAHARGVIHRDVKPENVLLDDTGRAKLADLGLARGRDDATLTRTGAVFGTLAYMAPEQIERSASAASDLYALGATLYVMLTGRLPFGAESHAGVLKRILLEPPDPPRTIRPEIPPALESICLRCLEKSPDRRHPSAAALATALSAWLAADGVLDPGPRECPNCRGPLGGTDRACPRCGTLFCFRCDSPVRPDRADCLACGVVLYEAEPERGWSPGERAAACGRCQAMPAGPPEPCYACGSPAWSTEEATAGPVPVPAFEPDPRPVSRSGRGRGLALALAGAAALAALVLFGLPRVQGWLARHDPVAPAACRRNLQALGAALAAYRETHAGESPPLATGRFLEALEPHLADRGAARCPSQPDGVPYVVLDLPSGRRLRALADATLYPEKRAGLARSMPIVWDPPGSHSGRRNVLFLDGHVEEVADDEFGPVLDRAMAEGVIEE